VRDERGQLIECLGQVNDVGLALQEGGHRGKQLASIDGFVKVEPSHVATEV
jgi:hypothetical protein